MVKLTEDGSEDEEMALADASPHLPRRLPWCSDEDYESAMAELDAEMCRWG